MSSIGAIWNGNDGPTSIEAKLGKLVAAGRARVRSHGFAPITCLFLCQITRIQPTCSTANAPAIGTRIASVERDACFLSEIAEPATAAPRYNIAAERRLVGCAP